MEANSVDSALQPAAGSGGRRVIAIVTGSSLQTALPGSGLGQPFFLTLEDGQRGEEEPHTELSVTESKPAAACGARRSRRLVPSASRRCGHREELKCPRAPLTSAACCSLTRAATALPRAGPPQQCVWEGAAR